jgi:hypothetical protein
LSRVRHIFGNATFNLAVYALPFFAGTAAGLLAYHTGAGVVGSAAAGLVAGAVTLVAGEFAFANSRSTIIRTMTVVVFALPAAVAGYHLVLGLSTLGMPLDIWRQAVAIAGALVVGSTAWVRLKRFDRETLCSTSLPASGPEPTRLG